MTVIADRINRVNGARVLVIDANHSKDFDAADGGRWVTWCDRHETFCQHVTRKLATYHAADPTTWCGLCAEGLD
jgi:hypothetical protein